MYAISVASALYALFVASLRLVVAGDPARWPQTTGKEIYFA
jgi:hypothetical protein